MVAVRIICVGTNSQCNNEIMCFILQSTLHTLLYRYIYSIIVFLQVYKQNIDLKVEISQLKLSEKNLSDEFEKLKDKYHCLSQDFEKTTFIMEAEIVMDQLEKTLIEIKANFEKSSLDKVHIHI